VFLTLLLAGLAAFGFIHHRSESILAPEGFVSSPTSLQFPYTSNGKECFALGKFYLL